MLSDLLDAQQVVPELLQLIAHVSTMRVIMHRSGPRGLILQQPFLPAVVLVRLAIAIKTCVLVAPACMQELKGAHTAAKLFSLCQQ